MTVYGTLMNFKGELEALASQMNEAPYKAPPKAPVLYVKTGNTFSSHGAEIRVPARVAEVEIGATLGAVIGANGKVAGYRLMNDLSIPHASFFRPPVKFKCLDGFLGIGAEVAEVDPAQAVLEVRINGELKQSVRFADLVRPAPQLLADVTGFMTLAEGDVLMLGCDWGRPRARAGDRIEISAAGFATLANTLVAEAA
ncbi:MAG: fumarylacetoacetate hydrolase family protein [Burkholderiales bacterium]|nr:fumarylacetoacetate hydrolase family protein [Burkholderiales bacterium]